MRPTRCYLFAHVYLNLTIDALGLLGLSIDELRLQLDFLCVHGNLVPRAIFKKQHLFRLRLRTYMAFFCAHNTVHMGAVLFLYIQYYLLAHSVPLMWVQCNLYALNAIYVS